jgi:hypothetical protein
VLRGRPAGVSDAIAEGLLSRRLAPVEQVFAVGAAGVDTGTLPQQDAAKKFTDVARLTLAPAFGVGLSLRREGTVSDFIRRQKHIADTTAPDLGITAC